MFLFIYLAFHYIKAGHWCLCGDILNRDSYPQVDEHRCSIPCSGDNQLMCGNTWMISIYQGRYYCQKTYQLRSVFFNISIQLRKYARSGSDVTFDVYQRQCKYHDIIRIRLVTSCPPFTDWK